jgi:hypothetical protein
MFYQEQFVKAGRKEKTCDSCSKKIEKGQSAYTIPGEDFMACYICTDCYPTLVKYCQSNNITQIEGVDFEGDYYDYREIIEKLEILSEVTKEVSTC